MHQHDILEQMINIVHEIVQDRIPLDKISGESDLHQDLGLDSYNTLELFLTVMSSFHVEIDYAATMDIHTINDICELVSHTMGTQGEELPS